MLAYPSYKYIKMFGGSLGSPEYDSRITNLTEKAAAALLSLPKKLYAASKINVGDIVHLKKGYAKVINVYRQPIIGKVTIAVEYETGDNVGKQEVKQVPISERLSIVADKVKYNAIKNAGKFKDKVTGKKSEIVDNKSIKNLPIGSIISTENGDAIVNSIEEGEDKDFKVNLTYTSGKYKGKTGAKIFDSRDNIPVKLNVDDAINKNDDADVDPELEKLKTLVEEKVEPNKIEKGNIIKISDEFCEVIKVEPSDKDGYTKITYKYLSGEDKGDEDSSNYRNDRKIRHMIPKKKN